MSCRHRATGGRSARQTCQISAASPISQRVNVSRKGIGGQAARPRDRRRQLLPTRITITRSDSWLTLSPNSPRRLKSSRRQCTELPDCICAWIAAETAQVSGSGVSGKRMSTERRGLRARHRTSADMVRHIAHRAEGGGHARVCACPSLTR